MLAVATSVAVQLGTLLKGTALGDLGLDRASIKRILGTERHLPLMRETGYRCPAGNSGSLETTRRSGTNRGGVYKVDAVGASTP